MVSTGRLQARLCPSVRKMSRTKTNESIREHKTEISEDSRILCFFPNAHPISVLSVLTVIPGMGFGSKCLPRCFRHQ